MKHKEIKITKRQLNKFLKDFLYSGYRAYNLHDSEGKSYIQYKFLQDVLQPQIVNRLFKTPKRKK